MRPLFSIVTPIYNGEDHIKGNNKFCLNQSFENFEYIIVNDGSTDNSRVIIQISLK